MNGWLDPTNLGDFKHSATNEIRTSLTLEDTPLGIPGATYPTPEDRQIIVEDFPISAGDTLTVEINELRQRGQAYQAQVQVTPSGFVSLPVLGRIQIAGMTVTEFQAALVAALQEKSVLVDPDVTVNTIFMQKATYSLFGVGVSAANNAPLRAGIFPIRRPDLTLLEAINQVGGLNEFVTEIYVFRYDQPKISEQVIPQPRAPMRESAPQAPVLAPVPNSEPEPLDELNRADQENAATAKVHPQTDPEVEDLLEAAERADQREKDPIVPVQRNEDLTPEPPSPYLYVDGEFVPNPEYRGPAIIREPEPGEMPPAFDTVAPAVNWARLAGETTFRIIAVPANQLRSGDPQVNIYVRPGDVIRIVSGEIGVYYVMGQVNRAGGFAFNAEPVTLKQAVAAAGGLSGLAWPDRCTVYRQLGQRDQMIQVNLDRVFAGQDADFFIKRGDIINVGTHPFAPFLQRIRGLTLPNPVTNVGYTFTYARNFADIDSFAVRQNPANEPDRFPNLFP